MICGTQGKVFHNSFPGNNARKMLWLFPTLGAGLLPGIGKLPRDNLWVDYRPVPRTS